MIRTQVYLPKSQIHQLKKEAQKRETTVSEVLRRLIDERLEPSLKTGAKRESLEKTAKRIRAIKTEGPMDLAQNMDEYLYGAV